MEKKSSTKTGMLDQKEETDFLAQSPERFHRQS